MNRFTLAASRRGFGAICLVAGAVALSAACSSASTPGPSPSAVGGSGAASPTPTASAGGGASAGASDTAQAGGGAGGSGGATTAAGGHPAGANTCLVRYLHGDIGQVGAAAGSEYVTITFKNLNNQPCTLYGYPGVSAGNGTPVNQVGQPANRNNAVSPTVVTLAPGGYAYTTLQIANALNYPTATCKPASTSWLLVYPPNTSNLLYVPYDTKVCTTSTVNLSIQAVRPGKGGA
ncbi:MAG TPA: DUF4232 domain-containing protein [Actinocrinis sp.]|uniref:DUF4232 domain-containing protein n=1 Tax=Actinocrinis sp. TaxID=1920516 RepID=UPI002D6E663F|nr:DUF4232 domain-containing protein [Actinocrinis sp.]HZU58609.1 DUF4232 domain-containing protein [Actinocrinis sp.]